MPGYRGRGNRQAVALTIEEREAVARRNLRKGIKYTQALADEICKRHAEGETLRQICKDEHMPDESAVRLWYIEDRNGFAEPWQRARHGFFDRMADEIIEIADDGSNDWIKREMLGGRKRKDVDREHVSRSNLRVNTRLWILTRALPHIYSLRAGPASKDPQHVEAQLNSSHEQDLMSVIRDLKKPSVRDIGEAKFTKAKEAYDAKVEAERRAMQPYVKEPSN